MDLPFEIWENILQFSDDLKILPNLSLTCHDFYELTQNDSLWEIMIKGFNFNYDIDSHIRDAENYLKIKLKSLNQETEKIPSKMIFIYLYEHSCIRCHAEASNFYTHLNGYCCHKCGKEDLELVTLSEQKNSFI